MRSKAEYIGLDPNKWFDNVEQIAMKEIGRETVEYVANIHKYYLAYKTIYTTLQKKKKLAISVSMSLSCAGTTRSIALIPLNFK